jgi:ribosomal protein S18 acetylase RimI-like enzyme
MVDVRPYLPADRDAVNDVCLRTVDEGIGVLTDPTLVADVFAGPYLLLAPEFAFVADDGSRVVGYVLGTPDSARFYRAMRETWLPLVDRQVADTDRAMADLLHHPERLFPPALADHPAHLHVNLLPAYQRAGHGGRLMAVEFAALRRAGASRVHLGVATANTAARAFYARLGFLPIHVPDAGRTTYLGRELEKLDPPPL